MRIRVISLSALLAFLPAALFAEAGTSGGQTLARPIGARAAAMGQAFTAVGGDPESLIYNPAGTGFVSSATISLSYLRGYAKDGTGLLAASYRLGRVVLTPALLYYNAGTINLNLSDGTKGEVTAQEDKVGMMNVAVNPFDFLSVGGTLKYSQFRLAETASAKAVNYDVGAIVSMWGLSAGIARQNMGGSIKFEEESDPPPTATRLGLAVRQNFEPLSSSSIEPESWTLLVSGDMVKPDKESTYYQTGLEVNMTYDPGSTFAVRGGYLFNRSDENFTLGFGTIQGSWGFDYALGGSSNLGSRHQMTLSYHFAAPSDDDEVQLPSISVAQ